ATTSGVWAGGGCPTTPSAGNSTGSARSGSASATSCRPTRSARKKRRVRWRFGQVPAPRGKLFLDETGLLPLPPLHAGWALRGQPAPVPLSGANAKRVLFGVLNIDTGYRLLLDRQRQRGADFRAFLRVVRRRYWGRHIAMVLDEDSSHTAGASR